MRFKQCLISRRSTGGGQMESQRRLVSPIEAERERIVPFKAKRIRSLLASGELPGLKVGASWLLDLDQLDERLRRKTISLD